MQCMDYIPTKILNQTEKGSLLRYELGVEDGYLPNLNIDTHDFLVCFDLPMSSTSFEDYSPLQKCEVEYNTIVVMPRERLMLSGIDVLANEDHPAPSRLEVIIIENERKKAFFQCIESELEDSLHLCHFNRGDLSSAAKNLHHPSTMPSGDQQGGFLYW